MRRKRMGEKERREKEERGNKNQYLRRGKTRKNPKQLNHTHKTLIPLIHHTPKLFFLFFFKFSIIFLLFTTPTKLVLFFEKNSSSTSHISGRRGRGGRRGRERRGRRGRSCQRKKQKNKKIYGRENGLKNTFFGAKRPKIITNSLFVFVFFVSVVHFAPPLSPLFPPNLLRCPSLHQQPFFASSFINTPPFPFLSSTPVITLFPCCPSSSFPHSKTANHPFSTLFSPPPHTLFSTPNSLPYFPSLNIGS